MKCLLPVLGTSCGTVKYPVNTGEIRKYGTVPWRVSPKYGTVILNAVKPEKPLCGRDFRPQ